MQMKKVMDSIIVLLVLSFSTVAQSQKIVKPNIIWISCEDMGPLPGRYDANIKMRAALGTWQFNIGDKGFVPEHELVNMFWPQMIQPLTAELKFETLKDGNLKLSSVTGGASIAYSKTKETDHWLLYSKPIEIKDNETIYARAIRIGYKTSNIFEYLKTH